MDAVNQTYFPELTETISLENPTEVDPSLILITQPASGRPNIPLVTHNYQIKNELSTLILNNGNQNISYNICNSPHHRILTLTNWARSKREVRASRFLIVAWSLSSLAHSVIL